MDALALKLTVTPALIGAATLIGRRWGPVVSGWLVGFPFTSAPVAFFTALAHGNAFAAQVSLGILLGTISQTFCALAYARSAANVSRSAWPVSLAAATLVFAAFTVLLHPLHVSAVVAFVLVVACNTLALASMPRARAALRAPSASPAWWDLPFRMLVATVLVVVLTEIANVVGPRWTGLLSPYPLFAIILTVFAQREAGGGAAVEVMRGLQVGLFAFAVFFLAAALLLEPIGLFATFACALVATLALEAAALWILRRANLTGA